MSRFPCSVMAVCKQSVLLWGHMALLTCPFIFRAPPRPQCLSAGSMESHSCMPAWCMLPTPKFHLQLSVKQRLHTTHRSHRSHIWLTPQIYEHSSNYASHSFEVRQWPATFLIQHNYFWHVSWQKNKGFFSLEFNAWSCGEGLKATCRRLGLEVTRLVDHN